MNVAILILIAAGFIAALFFLVTFLKKQLQAEMKSNQEQYWQLLKSQFETEQNKAKTELETRKQAVQSSIEGLEKQLGEYKQLMREFEKDRDLKYGNLESQLRNASENTTKLQDATNKLTNVLSSSQKRGEWGERMAEDIIRYAGLIENVNYTKQRQIDTGVTRPDYTFLLPNDHKVNMDVKFPLDNYTKMVNAETSTDKELYRKEFVKNVKDRVKEIQNRSYINPEEKTLDFVLLFIPNEKIYSLIHEKMPEFVDSALEQKVVLCSPFTLYAMLSVIRQAYENFRYEKNIHKIVGLIDQFVDIYGRAKDRFDAMGDLIQKLEVQYNDIKTKNFKQLDTKIRHIEEQKKGKALASLGADDEILIDTGEASESAIEDKTAVS